MPPGSLRVSLLLITTACASLAQEQILEEAARLDSEQKCNQSELLYQRALAAGLPSPALLNNLGNHYLTCGSPANARDAFERLLKLNPAHVNANLQLARLALADKDSAAALKYLTHIKAQDDAEISLIRAEALYLSGKHEQATSQIDRLIQAGAGDPRILFAAGITCGRIGLYSRAESAFSAVLAKVPDDFDVLYNLGLAAARSGHLDRAQQAFETALKTRPGDADSLYELGRVESDRHDYTRAVYLLAQARKAAPQRPDVMLALARASQMAGFYGDALLAYDDYLRLRPIGDSSDDIVRRDRALLSGFRRDGLPQGIKDLSGYLEKHPNDGVGHYDLAQLLDRSDRAKALAEVTVALRLTPDLQAARFFRAKLLEQSGREEESIADLQLLVKQDPGNARALDLLGLDYLNIDKPAEAEKALRQATRLVPDDPDVLFHLSRALTEMGRATDAKPLLERFQKLRGVTPPRPREDAGLIEAASLPPAERDKRLIEHLKGAVAHDPHDGTWRVRLATAFFAAGQAEQGLAQFRELLTMNITPGVAQQAGVELLRFEQYGLARDFLERAAADIPQAKLDLAIALFSSGNPEKALSVLDQLPNSGDRGDFLLIKARILDALGRTAEAEQAMDEGAKYAIDRPRLAEDAALLLANHKREPAALELLHKAELANPEDAGLLLAQAAILASAGRNTEAQKIAKEIERRWPEWDRAYLMEGLVLERESRIEEAKRRIGVAITLGTQDPAARCAVARMSGQTAFSTECSCQLGIYHVFFAACANALR